MVNQYCDIAVRCARNLCSESDSLQILFRVASDCWGRIATGARLASVLLFSICFVKGLIQAGLVPPDNTCLYHDRLLKQQAAACNENAARLILVDLISYLTYQAEYESRRANRSLNSICTTRSCCAHVPTLRRK